MLADSQNDAERVLGLETEQVHDVTPSKRPKIEERYQCVVCQLNTASLTNLHWHQTYEHSTEELSMSVMGWKGIVKIVGPSSPREKENSQRSMWSSFSKKPSQFYYLSSSILNVKGNQKPVKCDDPIDCSLPMSTQERNICKLNKRVPLAKVDKKQNFAPLVVKAEENSENVSEFCLSLVMPKVTSVSEVLLPDINYTLVKDEENSSSGEDFKGFEKWECDVPANKIKKFKYLNLWDNDLHLKQMKKEINKLDEPRNVFPSVKVNKCLEVNVNRTYSKVSDSGNDIKNLKAAQLNIATINKICSDNAIKSENVLFTKQKIEKSKLSVEEELRWKKEISMEDFIHNVDKLCKELEDYKLFKKPAKRKFVIKSND